jgi:hypothetical protein
MAMTALFSLLAGLAFAAEPVTLVFPSGGRLSGVLLRDSGEVYVLERDGGQLEFPHGSVSEVVREPNADAEFRAREAAAPPGDAAALWELARFAAENGLPGRAERAAERILSLDPEHPGARAFLGYARVFGEWRRGDALKRAQGFVRHEGEWMTLAQRKALLAYEARADDEARRRPRPAFDGLALALETLTRRLSVREPEGITRFVLMDGGASAREHARRARFRFGRREDDEQGARPWRPEPFRVGSSTLGLPPMEPVGSRIGF